LAAIAFAIATNPAAVERVQSGFARVSLGIAVLQNRESMPGYSGFEEREYWMHEGVRGWSRNPVFGYGTEGFRAHFGITSHSTPVDLLYNTGIIGFSLFYAMFGSLAWRLLTLRHPNPSMRSIYALVLAGVICQVFISLSGTAFYQTFIAIFVATSAALLSRYRTRALTSSRARHDGLPALDSARRSGE
jgi:O-antigen ligase